MTDVITGKLTTIRMATGLRTAFQSVAWIGAEAGVFARHGVELEFPGLEVGGPEAAAGLSRGDWEFAFTGALPFAQEVLEGRSPVTILMNTPAHPSFFLMTPSIVTGLAQLTGRRIGVPSSLASIGQAGVAARNVIEAAGGQAIYQPLGTFSRVYAALEAKEIDVGVLPLDLRLLGERVHRWHATPVGSGFPSVIATTRQQIAENRDNVLRTMRGLLDSFHLFRTRPDITVPLLQRFMNFEDDEIAEAVRTYYAAVIPLFPRPDLDSTMNLFRVTLAKTHPTVAALTEPDLVDCSLIDELAARGLVEHA